VGSGILGAGDRAGWARRRWQTSIRGNDEAARRDLDAAWDAGIRYFDTAPHYGIGLAERRMAPALRTAPGRVRAVHQGRRLLVANPDGAGTRTGQRFDVTGDYAVWDWSADGIRRSLAESLERLGWTASTWCSCMTRRRATTPEAALADGFPGRCTNCGAGVIGAIGVGSKQIEILRRFVARLTLTHHAWPAR